MYVCGVCKYAVACNLIPTPHKNNQILGGDLGLAKMRIPVVEYSCRLQFRLNICTILCGFSIETVLQGKTHVNMNLTIIHIGAVRASLLLLNVQTELQSMVKKVLPLLVVAMLIAVP